MKIWRSCEIVFWFWMFYHDTFAVFISNFLKKLIKMSLSLARYLLYKTRVRTFIFAKNFFHELISFRKGFIRYSRRIKNLVSQLVPFIINRFCVFEFQKWFSYIRCNLWKLTSSSKYFSIKLAFWKVFCKPLWNRKLVSISWIHFFPIPKSPISIQFLTHHPACWICLTLIISLSKLNPYRRFSCGAKNKTFITLSRFFSN